MDKNTLLQFRNKLFQGGVAYNHVKRNLRELKDHIDDIQQQACQDGYSNDEAKVLSMEQIGNLDNLAEDIISRPELKSFGYRYPKFSLLFGPLLTYVITVVSLGLLLTAGEIASTWVRSELNLPPYSYWLNQTLEFFRIILLYFVPPILSIIFVSYGLKNRLAKKYYVWGVLLLCVVSCAVTIRINWPNPVAGIEGSVGISIGTYGRNIWGGISGNLRLMAVLGISFIYMFLFQKKLEREEI